MLARSLNLGILAHVDAGKTTLTERLLHLAGVIDEPGSVDAGTTRTDTLALERRRGITIKAAVVAFPLDDVTVNVLDTPGHPDFIAEVERVLGVLDGAVLVLSAVEGVQPQTRILMRALQRLECSDAAVRQQDRPDRRRRRRDARGGQATTTPARAADGSGRRRGLAGRDVHSVPSGRRRVPRAGDRRPRRTRRRAPRQLRRDGRRARASGCGPSWRHRPGQVCSIPPTPGRQRPEPGSRS